VELYLNPSCWAQNGYYNQKTGSLLNFQFQFILFLTNGQGTYIKVFTKTCKLHAPLMMMMVMKMRDGKLTGKYYSTLC